jgi:pimeloyl-ACP methyl ester carboxylesterase
VGGYVQVGDLKIYHEIHGAGDPIVLLHGGVTGVETFSAILPELSRNRQVIAVDMQGHGRTRDIDRPLSYEAMGDDVAGLLGQLHIDRADVMGYSLGAGTALQTAIRHPAVVRKLVVVSQPVKRQGWYPEVLAGMDRMGPAVAEGMKQSPLAQLYPDVNWERLFTKLSDLLRQEYDWSAEVKSIKSPMLIAFADADAVRMSHILEFFALLGGGQRDAGLDGSLRPRARLAIIPHATHYDIISSPTLPAVLEEFLTASD